MARAGSDSAIHGLFFRRLTHFQIRINPFGSGTFFFLFYLHYTHTYQHSHSLALPPTLALHNTLHLTTITFDLPPSGHLQAAPTQLTYINTNSQHVPSKRCHSLPPRLPLTTGAPPALERRDRARVHGRPQSLWLLAPPPSPDHPRRAAHGTLSSPLSLYAPTRSNLPFCMIS